MNKKISILLFMIAINTIASATDFNDFINQTKIDGDIRAYDFNTDFGKEKNSSKNAFSLGGALNLLTGPMFINGLQVGASFYTAQPLGLNSSNHKHIDTTLPGNVVNTLGQTFLQYQNNLWLVRAGNQIINTPWLNEADSRMIPATYQGFYSTYSFDKNLTLTALRIFRFKSRVENNFSKTNLYNPQNDASTEIPAFDDTKNNGAFALGSDYHKKNINSQLWYYRFYDLANLIYGDTQYQFSNATLKPYLGAQVLHEWNDGNNLLAPYEGGNVHANALGMILGIQMQQYNLSAAYNNIPKNNETFKEGDILSPYTSGYANDPLYTTSMLSGLIEKASGQAMKFKADYTTADKTWQFDGSYAKYYTAPNLANTTEVDLDAIYQLHGKFKGLSFRDRVGLLNGNTTSGRTLNNRVMVQYAF